MTDPNLRVTMLSNFVGGYAAFSCVQGYGLHGPQSSTCLPTGEWKQPFPTCSGKYLPRRNGKILTKLRSIFSFGEMLTKKFKMLKLRF